MRRLFTSDEGGESGGLPVRVPSNSDHGRRPQQCRNRAARLRL